MPRFYLLSHAGHVSAHPAEPLLSCAHESSVSVCRDWLQETKPHSKQKVQVLKTFVGSNVMFVCDLCMSSQELGNYG